MSCIVRLGRKDVRIIFLVNTGCVLTTLHLMQALDAHKYHDEIVKMFKQLIDIDPQRIGRYSDLCKSCFVVK